MFYDNRRGLCSGGVVNSACGIGGPQRQGAPAAQQPQAIIRLVLVLDVSICGIASGGDYVGSGNGAPALARPSANEEDAVAFHDQQMETSAEYRHGQGGIPQIAPQRFA